jgi:uncharacterized protein (TIGR02391 family)
MSGSGNFQIAAGNLPGHSPDADYALIWLPWYFRYDMDLAARVDTRLWSAVEHAYEARDYTATILDAIHFLGQLIRERSGLESDGQALVGAAFGGANPVLKVNQLQTESDWNVQRGIESLLRGLYQAIRNPRSHQKHSDSL